MHSGKKGCTCTCVGSCWPCCGGLSLIRWSGAADGVDAPRVLSLPPSCRPHLTLLKAASCMGFADTALQGGAGSCTGAPLGSSSPMFPLAPAAM
jgi:hypothetical protein